MIAEKVGPVGRLVFNKPQKHNATSTDMWEAIPVILDDFEKDPAIRVVVVTGAGDKAFVSGADISEFEKARNTPEQVAYYDKIGEVANSAPQQVLQADDRPHPRLLHRRRAGGVAALRHPHRLGEQQVRRAGGATRARLSRQRPEDPDRPGRARRTPRRSSSPPGTSPPRKRFGMGLVTASCPTPSSIPMSTTTAG